MENTPKITTKSLFAQDNVRAKFEEMLGKRAPQFITSVLQIASQNEMLAKADPMSIYNAAATAATLDLPLNNSLGLSYIVPYRDRKTNTILAQFQIGYKGFKQLAIRTGQFEIINETDVREGEINERNRLTGEISFNWIQDEKERLSKRIIGYVSYFKLVNGYSHMLYMTAEKIEAHAKTYSQSYKGGYGQWKDDFDGMALKTVIKLNLSKNAPLSVDIQRAIVADQSYIKDAETEDVEYLDNEPTMIDSREVDKAKEYTRITDHINNSKTLEQLKQISKDELLDELQSKLHEDKEKELQTA